MKVLPAFPNLKLVVLLLLSALILNECDNQQRKPRLGDPDWEYDADPGRDYDASGNRVR